MLLGEEMVSGQMDSMLMYDATVCVFLILHHGLSQVPGTTQAASSLGKS